MQVRHPLAGEGDGVPPARVDVNGTHVPVEDGTFAVDDESWLQRFADAHDTTPEALVREEDDDPDDDTLSWDPSNHTVDEVREYVESIDGDDIVATLESYRAAEANGKDRTTALEAIDSRLDDLREDD